ncbi:electron transfer flavoprotein subunit alpha/FixB family protein [Salisediminibacterium halotolerans]|uniref:electron transfer flavoprotein subunit alpha/FixB family protein n=1 Tax=Salisediminibacterium halotolerans TaxID=517425 RepID=UPI000EB2D6D9|nr:electron transfer flavoprotein subunit alpha/FixB family protein [Salisediminibacterium halotolerans]RLJ80907.1 electron transfer flavoprotein alpha subunit apoprotein [Actinophytocola xinjiangensis]RPE83906.1 electron transfer flavoprotein alpha subunit apoprotein [Salisediminibacterium halotolerans]TWG37850.1 electron transfer flavoprotein alpha subunit apoprotein [Salisediminibacterium halotolerans]GEL08693.1 electron transfer flavoprotein subunit alpha [Salisediminibacterium halotolerans
MSIEEYKDVWVFIEQREGEIFDVGLELLGAGRELADKLEVNLCGVLLGNNVKNSAEDLYAYGADIVYVIDDPVLENYRTETYMKAVGDLVRKYKPEIFIYGATSNGKDLASAVATEVMTGLTADTTMLDINLEKRLFEASRPAFGGNIMATILCKKHRPQMATVRPKVMKKPEADFSRTGKIIEEGLGLKEEDLQTKIIDIVKSAKKSVNLEESDIIVTAGKGIKDEKGMAMVKELADTLNADLGASRDVVEAGLIGHAHQVGQTGVTVTPKLYIVIGVSGAVQHTVGMQNSDVIIAINNDPEAAIFNVAHYGIVADAFEIVPKLTAELKKALDKEGVTTNG